MLLDVMHIFTGIRNIKRIKHPSLLWGKRQDPLWWRLIQSNLAHSIWKLSLHAWSAKVTSTWKSQKEVLILIQPRGSVKPYNLFKTSHKQMLREEYKHWVFYYSLTLPTSNCFQFRSFLKSTREQLPILQHRNTIEKQRKSSLTNTGSYLQN